MAKLSLEFQALRLYITETLDTLAQKPVNAMHVLKYQGMVNAYADILNYIEKQEGS